jgi:hypothetical protein
MFLGIGLPITAFGTKGGVADTPDLGSGALRLLGNEPQGLAIDFTDMSMVVRDTGTPANNFSGDPNTKLTYTSPSTKWIENSAGILVSGTTLRTGFLNSVAQGLLVEESRTNTTLYSQTPSNAYWVNRLNVVVTSESQTAPDGTSTAALFTDANTGGTATVLPWRLASSETVVAGQPYTLSVFAKAGTCTRMFMRLEGDYVSGARHANFDLSNGTIGIVDAGVTATINALPNGYYRCTITVASAASSGSGGGFYIGMASADGVYTITSNGTQTLYSWGIQMEQGAFATSYIQTSASTVTRAADSGLTLATSAYPHSATVNSGWIEYVPANVAAAMVALRWDDGTSN